MSPGNADAVSIDDLLEHMGFIRTLARDLVGDVGEAEDVAQETLLAALERPPAVRRDVHGLIRGIVRNVYRMRVRGDVRRERREQVVRDVSGSDPKSVTDDAILRAERRTELVQAVMRLAEPYRSAIVLRYMEELAPSEIAVALDAPVATVKTRLVRALEMLRRDLGRCIGESEWRTGIAILLVPAAATRRLATSSLVGSATTKSLLPMVGAIASVATVAIVVVLFLVSGRSSDPARLDTSAVSDASVGRVMPIARRRSAEASLIETPTVSEPVPPTDVRSDERKFVVVDEDGVTIEGVVVTTASRELVTDSEGRVDISMTEPVVRFVHPDYVATLLRFETREPTEERAASDAIDVRHRVVLTGGVERELVVVDKKTKHPVVGAVVSIREPSPSDVGGKLVFAGIGRSGVANDFDIQTTSSVDGNGEENIEEDAERGQEVIIDVNETSSDTLIGAVGRLPDRRVVTDVDGRVRLRSSPQGWPELSIASPEHLDIGHLRPDAGRHVEVVGLTSSVRLRIGFGSTRPVAEANGAWRGTVIVRGRYMVRSVGVGPKQDSIMIDDLVAGAYEVTATAESSLSLMGFDRRVIDLSQSGFHEMTLFSHVGATLTVRLGSTASEVDCVTLRARSVDVPRHIEADRSGGDFVFRGLPVGAYRIIARRRGHVLADQSVDVPEKTEFVTHDLRIAPGRLMATADDTVRVVLLDPSGRPVRSGRAERSKPCRFEGLSPGDYEVWFGQERRVDRQSVTIGSGETKVHLAATGRTHRLVVGSKLPASCVSVMTTAGWNLHDQTHGVVADRLFENTSWSSKGSTASWELPAGNDYVASLPGRLGQAKVTLDRDRTVDIESVRYVSVTLTCVHHGHPLRYDAVAIARGDASTDRGGPRLEWTDGQGRIQIDLPIGATYRFETVDGALVVATIGDRSSIVLSF